MLAILLFRLSVLLGLFIIPVLLGGCMPASLKTAGSLAQDLERDGSIHRFKLRIPEQKLPNQVITQDIPAEDELVRCRKPLLVMLHGTPGDWKIFAPQFADERLSSAYHLIAIERPGWGGSRIENTQGLGAQGGVQVELDRQVEALKPAQNWLGQCRAQPLVLLGHSYGATLAPLLAKSLQDSGNPPAALVLLAGNYSDTAQHTRWYNKLADTRVVQWMIGDGLTQSNDEMMALNTELAKLDPVWKQLDSKLIFVQGSKDKLVSPANLDYALQLQQEQVFRRRADIIRLNGEGHLFHLVHPARLSNRLLELKASIANK